MLRRAQISVFIIIGILIIAIFGFMFFITSEVGKIKLETQANKIVDSILAATPINYYVTLCLEEATKSALNISAVQGGRINLTGQQTLVDTNGNNISYYLVNHPALTCITPSGSEPCNPLPDAYPCTFFMGDNYDSYPAYCAFLNNLTKFHHLLNTTLGTTNAPMLCKNSSCPQMSFNVWVQGWNRTNINPVFFQSALENSSIQKDVETFITNATASCSQGILNISASNFTALAFRKFNITVGNISVSTIFGFNGVEVYADYPLLIKIQDLEPVIRILKFSYFSQVRYSYIYLLARWIAEQESRELDFSIARDWANKDRYRQPNDFVLPGFSVATKRAERYNNATIVTITDTDNLHYLRSGPIVFNFAIENRPPVLDYMQEYVEGTYDDVLARDYDICVAEGDVVEINPKAYDPDDNELNYSYSGWKQTSDAYFNESYLANGACRQTPEDCVIQILNKEPYNWTHSQKYHDEFPSASYKTNHSDIGTHTVTVCAYQINNESMRDCQDVRILVDDVFIVVANASMTTCFTDMSNNSLISLEDPLCLNADVIDYFNPGTTNYIWQIRYAPLQTRTIYDGQSGYVKLPLDYEPDIALYKPGKIDYFYPPIGDKVLKLLVIRGIGAGATRGETNLTVSAALCIPHRENSPAQNMIPRYPSFPFNNIDYENETTTPYDSYWDPFLGNHVCCQGEPNGDPSGWNYEPDTITCYDYGEYGLYNANFINFAEQANLSNVQTTATYAVSAGVKPAYDSLTNDVMLRNFTSFCSGSSGNSCKGSVLEIFSNITACRDWTEDNYQLLRCEGASKDAQYINASSYAPPSCIQFTDTTFEQYAGINNSSICGPPRCTENPDNPTGWGKGVNATYLCNATCISGRCQKPIVPCYNCKKYGDCEKIPDAEFGLQNGDYKTKQTLVGYSGICSSGASKDRCTNSTNFNLTDTCIDEDILLEYRCRGDVTENPDINRTENRSCSDFIELETEAHINDPLISEPYVCIPGNKSVCGDGACISVDLSSSALTENCAEGQFVGVSIYSSNSNGIPESCKFDAPVAPGSSEHACKVCGYAWGGDGSCT